jgi:hypothetical protein
MVRGILLLALFFGSGRLIAAEPTGGGEATSITRTLTAEEFARAGLNKLTPAELAYLDAALIRRRGQTSTQKSAPAPSAVPAAQRPLSKEKIAADFGAEQVAQNKPTNPAEELHTYIEGTVQEFSGRAVFVLANGQIWQQRTPTDVYLPKKLVNPAVTLIRGAFGYKMVIDVANVVVFVKRVQ